jgi:phosphoribosylformylglycinamidine synthase
VGARPLCLTDCLNFGNPEDPEVMGDFKAAVEGLSDAASRLEPAPVPYVSGNVSFYNESADGAAVPPSPIVAAFGKVEDARRMPLPGLMPAGGTVLLVGRRDRALGASLLERVGHAPGGHDPAPPRVRFEEEAAALAAVREAAASGQASAIHDVSEGGLLLAAAEMVLLAAEGRGLALDLPADLVAEAGGWGVLFSESGGFLVVPAPGSEEAVARRLDAAGAPWWRVGGAVSEPVLTVTAAGRDRFALDRERLAEAHTTALVPLFGERSEAAGGEA